MLLSPVKDQLLREEMSSCVMAISVNTAQKCIELTIFPWIMLFQDVLGASLNGKPDESINNVETADALQI